MQPDRGPQSLQDVIRAKQARAFVGREGQVERFIGNLDRGADDYDERIVIFAIDGQAGVGKSFLSRYFTSLARSNGSPAAISEDESDDILLLIESIASQFSETAGGFHDYRRKSSAYIAKRQELLSDPSAPSGTASIVTSAAVRLTLAAAQFSKPTSTLVEDVKPEALVGHVEDARAYLSKKLKKPVDRDLVLSPVVSLTAAFLSDLRAMAIDYPNVVVCVDTFERRSRWIQRWLIALLNGDYGPLPSNLIFVIAGQKPLDANHWSAFSAVMEKVSLAEFTEAEVATLLRLRGVDDHEVARAIYQATGGLPVLVDLLAQGAPSDSADLIDPTQPAVERFLKHEASNDKRQFILQASVARVITAPVLTAIASKSDAEEQPLDVLSDLPFIRKSGGTWTFHQVVRGFVLRYFRERDPKSYTLTHLNLFIYHSELAVKWLSNSATNPWKNAASHEAELVYHGLCAPEADLLETALSACVRAARRDPAHAHRLAISILDAGKDSEDDGLVELGSDLAQAAEQNDSSGRETYFSLLIDSGRLSEATLSKALTGRSSVRLTSGKAELALQDTDTSLQIDDNASSRRQRAKCLLQLGRADDCIEQLAELNASGDEDAESLYLLSRANGHLGQWGDAVKFITKAIDTKPLVAPYRAHRGVCLSVLGYYDRVVDDLTPFLEDEPALDSIRKLRADALRWIRRYDEALMDFDVLIAAEDPQLEHIVRRGEVLRVLGHYDEALEDAYRGAATDTMRGWATFSYGLALFSTGQEREAERQRGSSTRPWRRARLIFAASRWMLPSCSITRYIVPQLVNRGGRDSCSRA